MNFDYWRDMWKPMTEAHYQNVGYYVEKQLITDPFTGKQSLKYLRRLSLLEALHWNEANDATKCIEHIYPKVI